MGVMKFEFFMIFGEREEESSHHCCRWKIFQFWQNFKNVEEKKRSFLVDVIDCMERESMNKGSQQQESKKCLLRKIQWLSMEEDFHRCRWKEENLNHVRKKRSFSKIWCDRY